MYRFICLPSLFLACIVQGQDAKPDRSGERRLKLVFETMGKLKSLQARIDRFSREDPKKGWSPEGSIDFAFAPGGKFRVAYTGSWGDQGAFLSDGKTFLTDPHDLTAGVILKDAKSTIFENDAVLALRGGVSCPLYYFLAGLKGFDELVAKDGEVVSLPTQNGDAVIRFKSTKIGTVKIFFDGKDKRMLIKRFEYDDLENKKEMARMWAEWGAEEPTDPLDVHEIHYLSVDRGLSTKLFDTTPPKGLPVQDQREKKKASPRSSREPF